MSETVIRDLGDGLIMRHASPEDADELGDFNAHVHADEGVEFDEYISTWTRELLTSPHPTIAPGDFVVVVDTKTKRIVSSTSLLSQVWTYEGIPFRMGRPELVGTHVDYRRRGLVRTQMDYLHRVSAERGELVLGITGIPNYYRQFGYEMCLPLSGWRLGYAPQVPKLEGAEPYHIRRAAEGDLPFIAQVYEMGCRRYPVACVRDAAMWRFELDGRADKNPLKRVLCIIETPGGESVGFIAHPPELWLGGGLFVTFYELKAGIPWAAVTSSVVRYLESTGKSYAERDSTGEKKLTFEGFGFNLGGVHPAYDVFRDRMGRSREPYSWYIRVPDLRKFIGHIASALEERLAKSLFAGHTGELKLSFYRDGIRLGFENGKLSVVEPWQQRFSGDGDAKFPDLTFLYVLFCNRTPAELKHIFADCDFNSQAEGLLNAMFPKRISHIWPVA
jgi:hypothetical protein